MKRVVSLAFPMALGTWGTAGSQIWHTSQCQKHRRASAVHLFPSCHAEFCSRAQWEEAQLLGQEYCRLLVLSASKILMAWQDGEEDIPPHREDKLVQELFPERPPRRSTGSTGGYWPAGPRPTGGTSSKVPAINIKVSCFSDVSRSPLCPFSIAGYTHHLLVFISQSCCL